MSYASKIEELIAERDALRKDAERYRWLRDPASKDAYDTFAAAYFNAGPEGMDAAIDAAMAQQPA